MKLTPHNRRVLIKPEAMEKKTAAGIILPDTTERSDIIIGTVEALDPSEELSFTQRSRVLFNRFGFDKITLDDEEYYIGPSDDVLALIEEE